MIKRFFLYLFIGPCLSYNLFASPDEILSTYDIRSYHPEKLDLKDLIFEIRMKDLVKQLNETKSYGVLEDIYFKVFWIFPGQYNIEIYGLPKGFKALRQNLKQQIKSRLSFVIPMKLSLLFRSYNLKIKKENKAQIIEAIPKVKKDAKSKIMISFDSSGKLKSIDSQNEFINIYSEHTYKVFDDWSNNKWVLTEVTENRSEGPHRLFMKTQIMYKKVGKFGFPSKISISTTPSVVHSADKNSSKILKTTLLFSTYEVNTGKARKKIMNPKKN